MAHQAFKVGVDIGGTNTVVGAVNNAGQCVDKSSFLTQSCLSVEDFAIKLVSTLSAVREQWIPDRTIAGIGVASPAARQREGTIQGPANLKWESINVVSLLKSHFDVPIIVTNDSNAAALGEMKFGLARGMKNFVVITIGTGLGAGIVIDGHLLHGENGVAGELGHMTIEPGGRLCGCRRRGCVETYVSATGIRRTVFELLARSTEVTELRGIGFNNLTAERVYDLASLGDPIATEAFEATGKLLGRVLSNTVAVFDPEAIILSGGLMNAGDLLLKPTMRSFDDNVLQLHKRKAVILRSRLKDGEAAILGASSLIMNGSDAAIEDAPENPGDTPRNLMIEDRG
jgi:glucokinase